MVIGSPGADLRIFTTGPASAMAESRDGLRRLKEVARWSDEAGCEGILVFSDNRQLDPWLVSQVIIETTEHLCPLVAIQPAYMHPYTAAKMITSLAFLYGRRVYLNMVAGGFKNDLAALNDQTPHDHRYERLVEYTQIIQQLLRGGTVTFDGRYCRVSNLKLTPSLPPELMPGVLVSGSSQAGRDAAGKLRATAVEYPQPPGEGAAARRRPGGIRIGLIARDDDAEAWSVAHRRYPEDRRGQLAHELARKVSDSVWYRQLSEAGAGRASTDNPYWLAPFQNYKAMCPYLVGTYGRVAAEIVRYVECGCKTFILDEPPTAEEMRHIRSVFERVIDRSPVT